MSNLFQQVAGKRIKRNKFDKSHERKLTMNMGELIPMYLDEIVPGDKFRVKSEIFSRFAPLVAPIMHRINIQTHYFFVPNRLIWEDWEEFITGGEDGTATPIWPTISIGTGNTANWSKSSLADYLGLPTPEAANPSEKKVSVLPFRAYHLIWNEYFRDQNLQEATTLSKASGPDNNPVMFTKKNRCWQKDYLTSSLPWAQRGEEATLPIGNGVPVYKSTSEVYNADGSAPGNGGIGTVDGSVNDLLVGQDFADGGNGENGRIENIDSINITAETSINDLRKSVRLQEWLERQARGGARYIETILSHFNVRSSDARLQRPEFLGGGSTPMQISEVLQNSASIIEGTDPHNNFPPSPQGNMAGHGVGASTQNGFSKRFEEHGFVIGIMSVMPKTAYQQGINRMWTRQDKFDYYWPEFANLGEQEVKNQEVFLSNDPAIQEETFGYQSRYAEYKYGQSSVHGDFRDELDYWHLGRQFDSQPVLNSSFVEADPDPRIFAVTDPAETKIYCQIYNKVDALRPMPYFGTPQL